MHDTYNAYKPISFSKTITKAHDMLLGDILQVSLTAVNGFQILQTQTFSAVSLESRIE